MAESGAPVSALASPVAESLVPESAVPESAGGVPSSPQPVMATMPATTAPAARRAVRLMLDGGVGRGAPAAGANEVGAPQKGHAGSLARTWRAQSGHGRRRGLIEVLLGQLVLLDGSPA